MVGMLRRNPGWPSDRPSHFGRCSDRLAGFRRERELEACSRQRALPNQQLAQRQAAVHALRGQRP